MPRYGQGSTVRRYRAVNPAASIARCRCWARFAVAQAVQRRDPGLEATGIWRMSGNTSACGAHPSETLIVTTGRIAI